MVKKCKLLIVLLALCYSVTMVAQEIWTLDRCIAYALENNLTLKNAEVSREIQQVSLSQSRLNQLPFIGGEVSVNSGFGRSQDKTGVWSDNNTFSNTYGVGASVVLFSGFTQRNKIAFEKYNLRAENNRAEQQKNKVIYEVIEAYYQYLLKHGIYSLAVENLKLMQEQHYSTKRLIEVGRKAESDIYDFDAKLANDSFLLVQQTGDTEKALLKLKSIMNYPFADSLTIDTMSVFALSVTDTIDIRLIVNNSKANLPNLKVTENELLASKKYLAQVRGYFSPTLELNTGWSTGYYKTWGEKTASFNEQFDKLAREYIGVSLSIPLFSRFSKINNIKYAKLNYKKAEIAHQENIIFLENEVNAAYIDWKTNKNEYAFARKQLDKCQVAYLSAEKKLQLGQLNVIDYYIQKNDLMRAKTELLRTQLQLGLQERYVRFLLLGIWEY